MSSNSNIGTCKFQSFGTLQCNSRTESCYMFHIFRATGSVCGYTMKLIGNRIFSLVGRWSYNAHRTLTLQPSAWFLHSIRCLQTNLSKRKAICHSSCITVRRSVPLVIYHSCTKLEVTFSKLQVIRNGKLINDYESRSRNKGRN